MAIFLLTFVVCMLVCGFTITALLLSRTPRYRTDGPMLLGILDSALSGQLSENQWHATIGYPIRHDPYLESVRRRCQIIMEEYGRPWRHARDGKLFSDTGLEELEALRAHLNARLSMQQ